jgi:hypothetical protein
MEKIDGGAVLVWPRVVKPREPVNGGCTTGVGRGWAQGISVSRVPVRIFPGKAMVDLARSSVLRLRPFQHCLGVGGLGSFTQEGTSEICGSQLLPASAVGLNSSPQVAIVNARRIRLRTILSSF